MRHQWEYRWEDWNIWTRRRLARLSYEAMIRLGANILCSIQVEDAINSIPDRWQRAITCCDYLR